MDSPLRDRDMGHAFHQLYYHFVWATHARDPHIHRSFRAALLGLVHEEAIRRGGQPLRHNAMHDHVHLLVRLPPTVLVSEFIGQVKGAVAYRTNRELKPKFKLVWQEGYGVLTLRKDELQRVGRYIDNQEEHHASGRLSSVLERIESEEETNSFE
jgi:REP element-mobilizing transposase RayT